MTRLVRIATRQSKLALWQANYVRDRLLDAHPTLTVELVGMTTKGDRWLSAPLSEVGGKGLFIKELEAAMQAGAADIAVHSAKDLPASLPPGFSLPVLAYRDAVEDVLISRHGDLQQLPRDAVVGSSSLRRQAQLLAVRPDLQVVPIRGNVQTRLGKLDTGEVHAVVLAAAGLNRLGLAPEGAQVLPVDVCLPAPGQGALGIECLSSGQAVDLLTPLIDPEVADCVLAERQVSLGLGADCSLPIAAYAHKQAGQIHLAALVATADGKDILQCQVQGSDAVTVGRDAVEQLMAQGARRILTQFGHP